MEDVAFPSCRERTGLGRIGNSPLAGPAVAASPIQNQITAHAGMLGRQRVRSLPVLAKLYYTEPASSTGNLLARLRLITDVLTVEMLADFAGELNTTDLTGPLTALRGCGVPAPVSGFVTILTSPSTKSSAALATALATSMVRSLARQARRPTWRRSVSGALRYGLNGKIGHDRSRALRPRWG